MALILQVKNRVRDACNSLADHISEVSYENRKIKNMQVYWKVVKDYKLFFLFASYIKVDTFSKNLDREVLLRNNFNLREDIDFIYDTTNRKCTLKFKNIICLNCEKVTIAEKFIKIKND